MEVCRKTSRELSVAHRQQYPGTRSFPYRDCDWTECGLLALSELVLSHFLQRNINLICPFS